MNRQPPARHLTSASRVSVTVGGLLTGIIPALFLAGCAPAAERPASSSQPSSLVVGDLLRAETVGEAGCDPDQICLNVIVDARIGAARTLSGPKVRSPLTVRMEIHAEPAKGSRLMMLVGPPSPNGFRTGRWLRVARPGQEVCLEMDILQRNAIPKPASARLDGDRFCVRA
jgi:hypothetical protein